MDESTSANDQSSQNEEIPVNIKIKTEKRDESYLKQEARKKYVTTYHKIPLPESQDIPNSTDSGSNNVSNPNNTEQHASSSSSSEQQSSASEKDLSRSKSSSQAPPKAIDHRSKLGQFGWTAVGDIYLPFIIRGEEDRFMAVRMIECKVLSTYVDVLPWTVFACTNIKSYYITEHEAKLLNEINGFHCDFDYGYQTFTTEDVIVRLKDAVRFHRFLESCRTRLQPDCDNDNPEFVERCGFVMVNSVAKPYLKKGRKKYVLYDMVCTENIKSSLPEAKLKVSEWDLAYLRFLNSAAPIDAVYLEKGASLCALEDLQSAYGVEQFDEWWPDMQYSSKNNNKPPAVEPNVTFGESLPFMQPETNKNSEKLRENIKDVQTKDSAINPFFEYERHPDINWQPSKSSPHTVQNMLDVSQSMQSIANDNRASLFPSSLERLLATSSQPISYESQFSRQMQSLISDSTTRHLNSESGLSSLATSRPKPFPPPPPLVRVGETPESTTVPVMGRDTATKSPTSLYSYMPPTTCPPWLSHILDPEQQSARQASEYANVPMSHSRMLNADDPWSLSTSSSHGGGAGTSNSLGSFNNFCRDDRLTSFPRGSPRPAASAGAPPYYPTPPQSSPLQPMSILDCPPLPGITDIYGMRATPHGLGDMCSPPPSPETRTALPTSPRGGYGASSGYQAHITRLAQVDSRYLLAINAEPYKHNSVLAVPVSDVVSKFLRGSSVESCQVILETVFGLQLYRCTNLHQEAYAKHNVMLSAESKLVSVVDLRNYLYQLRFMLAEKEKQKEKHYDMEAVDLAAPLAKRFCSDEQETH